MELRINVDTDLDLRKFIKDQMRGQIDALAREDLKEIILAEVNRKISEKSDYLDKVLAETVSKWFNHWAVNHELKKTTQALFEEHILGSLGKIMIEKDWTSVIEEMARREYIRLNASK